MKHANIVKRNELKRALKANPNSQEIKKEIRKLDIIINWL